MMLILWHIFPVCFELSFSCAIYRSCKTAEILNCWEGSRLIVAIRYGTMPKKLTFELSWWNLSMFGRKNSDSLSSIINNWRYFASQEQTYLIRATSRRSDIQTTLQRKTDCMWCSTTLHHNTHEEGMRRNRQIQQFGINENDSNLYNCETFNTRQKRMAESLVRKTQRKKNWLCKEQPRKAKHGNDSTCQFCNEHESPDHIFLCQHKKYKRSLLTT